MNANVNILLSLSYMLLIILNDKLILIA